MKNCNTRVMLSRSCQSFAMLTNQSPAVEGGTPTFPALGLRLPPATQQPPPILDNRGYQPFYLQRPGRLKDPADHRNDLRNDLRSDLRNDFRNDLRNDIRNRLEDSTIPPAAKRQAQQEDSHDPRLPPPTTPGSGTSQSGANIKITSRGEYNVNITHTFRL